MCKTQSFITNQIFLQRNFQHFFSANVEKKDGNRTGWSRVAGTFPCKSGWSPCLPSTRRAQIFSHPCLIYDEEEPEADEKKRKPRRTNHKRNNNIILLILSNCFYYEFFQTNFLTNIKILLLSNMLQIVQKTLLFIYKFRSCNFIQYNLAFLYSILT
jgi:hypothetical protein